MDRLNWIGLGSVAALVGFLAANHPYHDSNTAATMAMIVVVSFPSLAATVKWVGARRGLGLVASLSIYAYSIEYVGLATGWPYGSFTYGSAIGPRFVDTLPVLLPLAYMPLVLGATSITTRFGGLSVPRWLAIGATSLIAFDLVVDPGAVALGYWSYANGGAYFDVPLHNFLGWGLTATVAMAIVWLWVRRDLSAGRAPRAELGLSAFMSLAFWTGVAIYFAMLAPAAIGAASLIVLLPHRRRRTRDLDTRADT